MVGGALRGWSRSRGGGHRQDPASPGVLDYLTKLADRSFGIRVAAFPTGMGWRTGRWRRWSATGSGSARTLLTRRRRRGSRPDSNDGSPIPPSGSSSASLGVAARRRRSRPWPQELFAGWRLFFERHGRARPSRAGFRGHGLRRRRPARLRRAPARLVGSAPIFMVTFARPELSEAGGLARRPSSAAAFYLEPLDDQSMQEPSTRWPTLPGAASGRSSSRRRESRSTRSRPCARSSTAARWCERESDLALAGDLGELDVPASLTALWAPGWTPSIPTSARWSSRWRCSGALPA